LSPIALAAEATDVAAELETLRAKAAQVEKLQQENASLQKQLLNLGSSSAPRLTSPRKLPAQHARATSATPLTPSNRTPLASKSTNEPLRSRRHGVKDPPKPRHVDPSRLPLPELQSEYAKLQDDYQQLYMKYAVIEKSHTGLEQILRAKQKTIDDWKKHSEDLQVQNDKRLRKMKALEGRLAMVSGNSLRGSSAGLSHTLDSLDRHAEDASNVSKLAHAENSDDDTTSSRSEVVQGPRSRNMDNATDQYDGDPVLPPMPESKNLIPASAVQVKNEPSSDPIVISEKILRKRKAPGDDDGPSLIQTKIKNEPTSDPVSIESDKFTAHESLDLDADGQLVRTPKKHRQTLREIPPLDESDLKEDQSHSGDINSRPQASEASLARATEDESVDRSSALRPLSANILRKRNMPLDVGGARFRKRRVPPGIASLAEDSELYDNEQGQSDVSRDRPSTSLLHNLLHSNTPGREAIVNPNVVPTSDSTPTPPSRTGNPKIYQFPVPEKRPLPFGEKTPRAVQPPPLTPQGVGSATPRERNTPAASTSKIGSKKSRQEAPLRGRPLTELKLSDFKINPAANDGFDYAFTDIVRGRDERSKLPGDLTVYGEEFRAQARAQRHSTNTLAFTSLLESWLGDDAYKLGDMSVPDKEALWEEAKTAELAKKCGRVKHRYQRQRTPPGAWRTDFPSTQEEEEYREQARKLDRKYIAERYREAMRPGGAWLFRDE